MPQLVVPVSPVQAAPPIPARAGVVAAYFIVVLLPIGLKLAHFTRVATWPWQKVTVFLWGPWALLAVLSLCGLTMRWAARLRRG